LLRRNIPYLALTTAGPPIRSAPACLEREMTAMEPYTCPREVNSLGFIAAALIVTMIVAGVGANVL
jgi:hypothetical protein